MRNELITHARYLLTEDLVHFFCFFHLPTSWFIFSYKPTKFHPALRKAYLANDRDRRK